MEDTAWGQIPEKVQGSQAWLDWRKKGLGASDAPIIMGVSPWKTPYKLWLEKTGKLKSEKQNWAQGRGHKLEPIARQKYEKLKGLAMPPETFTNGHLFASLDGWNKKVNGGLEIKCPGYPDHLTAMAGDIPEKYEWQLIHQCIVTKAKWIDYFSYHVEKDADDNTGDIACVRFLADVLKEKEYLHMAGIFWTCVLTKKPPPMTDKDFEPITDARLLSLTQKYETEKAALAIAELKVDHVKKEIIALMRSRAWRRVECGKAKIYEITKKGSVDNKLMAKENGLDPEKYRKTGSTYFRIDISDKGEE